MAKKGWISNFGRSVMFSAVEVGKNRMPAVGSIASDDNRAFLEDLKNTVNDIRKGQSSLESFFGKVMSDTEEGEAFGRALKDGKQLSRDTLKNFIKTGNTSLSKDRLDKEQMKAMGLDDLDLDMGDDDLGFDDDLMADLKGDIGASTAATLKQDAAIGQATVSALNANTKVQVEIGKNTANAIANVGQSINSQTSILVQGMDKSNQVQAKLAMNSAALLTSLNEKTLSGLEAINTNVANLVSFNQDTMTKMADSAFKYYDESLTELQKINATLLRAFPEKSEKETRESSWSKLGLDGYNSSINFAEYAKKIRSNLGNTPLAMLADPMFITGMLSDPITSIMQVAMEGFIPQILKSTMETIDNSFANFFPAIIGKITRYGEDNDSFFGSIAKIFGVELASTKKDIRNYEKGAVPFDGITHRTINLVIPRYLSEIVGLLGGERKMYDHANAKFISNKEIKKNIKFQDDMDADSAVGYDVRAAVKKELAKFRNTGKGGKARDKKWQDNVDGALRRMARSGKGFVNFDSDIDLLLEDMGWEDPQFVAAFKSAINSMSASNKMNLHSVTNRYNSNRFASNQRDSGNFLIDMHEDGFNALQGSSGRFKSMGSAITESISILSDMRGYLEQIARNTSGIGRRSGGKKTSGGAKRKLQKLSGGKLRRKNKTSGGASTSGPDDTTYTSAERNAWGDSYIDADALDDPMELQQALLDYNQTLADEKADKESEAEEDAKWFNRMARILRSPLSILDNAVNSLDATMYNLFFGSKKDGEDGIIGSIRTGISDLINGIIDTLRNEFLNPVVNFIRKDVMEGGIRDWVGGVRESVSNFFNRDFDNPATGASSHAYGRGIWAMYARGNLRRIRGTGRVIPGSGARYHKTPDGKRVIISGGETVFPDGSIMPNANAANMAQNAANEEAKAIDTVAQGLVKGTQMMAEEDKKSPNSIKGQLFGLFDDIKNNVIEHFFPEMAKDKDGKSKPFSSVVRDTFAVGLKNFSTTFFGTTKKDITQTQEEYLDDFKKSIPRGIARGMVATVGLGALSASGGLGLLGSLFLPGGPIGAAVLGMGVGFLSENEKFKEWLFGPKDQEGNRQGGKISKGIIDFVQKNKKTILGGTAVGIFNGLTGGGLITGLLGMLPGGAALGVLPAFGMSVFGPVTLAVGASLALKSERVQGWLFGEKTGDGEDAKRVGGLANTKIMQQIKKHAPNVLAGAGIGAIGSAAIGSMGIMGSLMIGPYAGAIAGGAIGLGLASDKFKEALFGKQDKKGNFIKGGLVDRMKNFFNAELMLPMKIFLSKQMLGMDKWFNKSILNPIRDAMTPYKLFVKSMLTTAKNFLTGNLKAVGKKLDFILSPITTPLKMIGRGLEKMGKTIMQKLNDTLFRLGGWLVRAAKWTIAAPVSLVTAPAKILAARYRNGTPEQQAAMAEADEFSAARNAKQDAYYAGKEAELDATTAAWREEQKGLRATNYAATPQQLQAKTDNYRREQLTLLQQIADNTAPPGAKPRRNISKLSGGLRGHKTHRAANDSREAGKFGELLGAGESNELEMNPLSAQAQVAQRKEEGFRAKLLEKLSGLKATFMGEEKESPLSKIFDLLKNALPLLGILGTIAQLLGGLSLIMNDRDGTYHDNRIIEDMDKGAMRRVSNSAFGRKVASGVKWVASKRDSAKNAVVSAGETAYLKGMYAKDAVVSAAETAYLKGMYAKDAVVSAAETAYLKGMYAKGAMRRVSNSAFGRKVASGVKWVASKRDSAKNAVVSAGETAYLKGMYAKDAVVSAGETAYLKGMYAKDAVMNSRVVQGAGNAITNAGEYIAANWNYTKSAVAGSKPVQLAEVAAEKVEKDFEKFKNMVTEAIEKIKALPVWDKVADKGAGVINMFTGMLSKVTPDAFKKVAIKFTKLVAAGVAKTAAGASTLGIATAAFALYDAYSGYTDAAQIIKVDPEDMTFGMQLACSVFSAIMGLPGIWVIDLLFEVAYAFSGGIIDIKKAIISSIYKSLPGTDDVDLDAMQNKAATDYEAWLQNAENEGKSFDQYLKEREEQTPGRIVSWARGTAIGDFLFGNNDENGNFQKGFFSKASDSIDNELAYWFGQNDADGNFQKGALQETYEWVGNSLNDFGQKIGNEFEYLTNAPANIWNTLFGKTEETEDGVIVETQGLVQNAFKSISDTVNNLADWVGKTISDFTSSVGKSIMSLFFGEDKAGEEAYAKAKKAFLGKLSDLKDKLTPDFVKDWWGDGDSGGTGRAGGGVGFQQSDPRWAGNLVGGNASAGSMSDVGCGPTALATAMAANGVGRGGITPADTKKLVSNADLANDGSRGVTPRYFSKAAAAMGGKFIPINTNDKAALESALASGMSVIAGGKSAGDGEGNSFTKAGHYTVLNGAYRKNGKMYTSQADPLGRNSGRGFDIDKVMEDVNSGGPSMLGVVAPAGGGAAGGGNIEQGLQAGMNAWLGKRMDNGSVGCAEAVRKIGSFYSPHLKKLNEEGDNSVVSHLRKAVQRGVSVVPYSRNNLSVGDSITWDNSSTRLGSPMDDDASHNNHIGIYTGMRDGEPWAVDNSSSALKVVERPLERSWQSAGWIIKTGDPNAKGVAGAIAGALGMGANMSPLERFMAKMAIIGKDYGMAVLGGTKYTGSDFSSLMGGSVGGSYGGATASAQVTGDNARDIWNYLTSVGYGPEDAAAIMGNLAVESGYSSTNLQNSYEGRYGSDDEYTRKVDAGTHDFAGDKAGYGLAQWTYSSRKQNLYDYVKSKGKSIGDLGAQLEFFNKESTEGYSGAITAMKNANGIAAKTETWMKQYEGPGVPHLDKRIAEAQAAYNQFANSSSGGSGGGGATEPIKAEDISIEYDGWGNVVGYTGPSYNKITADDTSTVKYTKQAKQVELYTNAMLAKAQEGRPRVRRDRRTTIVGQRKNLATSTATTNKISTSSSTQSSTRAGRYVGSVASGSNAELVNAIRSLDTHAELQQLIGYMKIIAKNSANGGVGGSGGSAKEDADTQRQMDAVKNQAQQKAAQKASPPMGGGKDAGEKKGISGTNNYKDIHAKNVEIARGGAFAAS